MDFASCSKWLSNNIFIISKPVVVNALELDNVQYHLDNRHTGGHIVSPLYSLYLPSIYSPCMEPEDASSSLLIDALSVLSRQYPKPDDKTKLRRTERPSEPNSTFDLVGFYVHTRDTKPIPDCQQPVAATTPFLSRNERSLRLSLLQCEHSRCHLLVRNTSVLPSGNCTGISHITLTSFNGPALPELLLLSSISHHCTFSGLT